MRSAKNSSYLPGGEDDASDPIGDNPTGRKRKSSARTRRKKVRRRFAGTPWGPNKN